MNISPENKQEAKYPKILAAAIVTAAAATVASCQQHQQQHRPTLAGVPMPPMQQESSEGPADS